MSGQKKPTQPSSPPPKAPTLTPAPTPIPAPVPTGTLIPTGTPTLTGSSISTGTPTPQPPIASSPTLRSPPRLGSPPPRPKASPPASSPTAATPKPTSIPSSSSQSSASQSASALHGSTISTSSLSSGLSSGSLPWLSPAPPEPGCCGICRETRCCIKCHDCSELDGYANRVSLHGTTAAAVGLLTEKEYECLGPLQDKVLAAINEYEAIWRELGPLQKKEQAKPTDAGKAKRKVLCESLKANEDLQKKLKAEGEGIVQKLVERFWAGINFTVKSPLERARLVFAWVAKSLDYYPGCKEKHVSDERSNAATILWGKEVCHGYCELFLAVYNHGVEPREMQAFKVDGWERNKPYQKWGETDKDKEVDLEAACEKIIKINADKDDDLRNPIYKSIRPKHDWIAVPLDQNTCKLMDPTWGSGSIVDDVWVPAFSPVWFYMDHEYFLRTHWPRDPRCQYLKSGRAATYQAWVEPEGPAYTSRLQRLLDVSTLEPYTTSIGIKDRTSIEVSFRKRCPHDNLPMTGCWVQGRSRATFKERGDLWVANYTIEEPVDGDFDLEFAIGLSGGGMKSGAQWRCTTNFRENKGERAPYKTSSIPPQPIPRARSPPISPPTSGLTPKPASTTTPGPTSLLTSKPTPQPTSLPASQPPPKPTPQPTPQPSSKPASTPASTPTQGPTSKPASTTAPGPTSPLTSKPAPGQTSLLTSKPIPGPTSLPTPQPTSRPTSPPPPQPPPKPKSPSPSRQTPPPPLVSTLSTTQTPMPRATTLATTAIPPTSTPTSPTGPRSAPPSQTAPPRPTQKKEEPPPVKKDPPS